MIIVPKIPEDVIKAPMARTFALSRDTIRALGVYGVQVPVFIGAYIQAWQPYRDFWNYEDGMIWKGALDLYAATKDRALLDFVVTEVNARVTPDGAMPAFNPSEYNIDGIQAGRVLPILYRLTGDDRYRKAMDTQMSQLLSHPRTLSGNYWHKQIYPSQVWLDGLYMAQPFQIAYARATGDAALFADSVQQFLNVETYLKDARTGLYSHGWDESRTERWADPQTGRSPSFWARAMGWWIMALVDSWQAADGPDPVLRHELARLLADTSEALLRVQSSHGLWYQVLDQGPRAGNYEEASASAMIAYALIKGARLGLLPPNTGAAGLKALKSLCSRFVTPSALEGICGVAGLGNTPYRDGSYAYYLSEKLTPNDPKGVGTLMMALSEGLLTESSST